MEFTSIRYIREEIGPRVGDKTFAHVEETVLIKDIGDAPIPERLDLQDLVRSVIPKHKVPNFRTFNISRVYSLKVKLEFECAKEKYKTKLFVPAFQILSQHWKPESASSSTIGQNFRVAELSASDLVEAPDTQLAAEIFASHEVVEAPASGQVAELPGSGLPGKEMFEIDIASLTLEEPVSGRAAARQANRSEASRAGGQERKRATIDEHVIE